MPSGSPAPSDGVDSIPLALDLDIVDLPAPVQRKGDSPAAHNEPYHSNEPALELVDLPAPKAATKAPFKAPAKPAPAPVAAKPPTVSAPDFGQHDEDLIDLPAPVQSRAVADLPAPKGRALPDLPAPKAAAPEAEPEELDGLDLVEVESAEIAPKSEMPTLGLSLDEPELDDLPAPKPRGALGNELAPKSHDGESASLAPKADVTDLAPAALEVAPVRPGETTGPPSISTTRVSTSLAAPGSTPAEGFVPHDEPRPRRKVALFAGGGALLVLVLVGVGLGLFTNAGYFGARIINGERAAEQTSLTQARRLLANDTIGSYQKAVSQLGPYVEQPSDPAIIGVSVQASYALVRLGAVDARGADQLLAKLDANEEAAKSPDVQKARALRTLVSGRAADAKTQLETILAAAPADASALTYLGWALLDLGDLVAARDAFARAVAAEPKRVAAMYGSALLTERMGDGGAIDKYRAVLAASPDHFRAQLGVARGAGLHNAKPAEAITTLIDGPGKKAGKRELAEAWTSLGLISLAAARRDEARDQLRKAVALAPGAALAETALGQVECDLGQADSALPSLRKLVMAQPKNLDARLALVRALLEAHGDGLRDEAVTSLAPAVKEAPKNARVLYWQARLALSATPPDKNGALTKLTAALAADGKLIPAYMTEARTLASLGRTDDAVAALKKASDAVAGDPQLLTELGDGYFGLGRFSDAETQYRAALAVDAAQYRTMLSLGAALEAQNKLDDAQATYEAVRAKGTNVPGATEALARLLDKRGHSQDAWLLFRTALAEGPNPSSSLRMAAATTAYATKRFDDAQKLVDSVLKEDDRNIAALILGAKLSLESNHADDGLVLARRAASISDLPDGHLVLGRLLEKLGKLDAAVAEYQLAKHPPVEAEAVLGHARIMVHMGATKDALAELQSLAHDPHLRAPALLLMGDCLSDLQQTDRARHAYEDAVAADPSLGEAAFKYGRALHDAGRRPQAAEMLARALKLSGASAPYQAEALLLLGDVHRELKQNADAVRAYKHYLEVAPADAPERVEVTRQIGLLGGASE